MSLATIRCDKLLSAGSNFSAPTQPNNRCSQFCQESTHWPHGLNATDLPLCYYRSITCHPVPVNMQSNLRSDIRKQDLFFCATDQYRLFAASFAQPKQSRNEWLVFFAAISHLICHPENTLITELATRHQQTRDTGLTEISKYLSTLAQSWNRKLARGFSES